MGFRNTEQKLVTGLTVQDLDSAPVWQYVNNDFNELWVKPVKKLPVKNLDGKIVGIQVRLANGFLNWSTVENIDITNPQLNEHFLTLSKFHHDQWFHLARYHDYDERDPIALSNFIGLNIEEIFPIHYDIRDLVIGSPAFLDGLIMKEPFKMLSRQEIIELAVP
jgi:hypothetical protein